MLWRCSSQPIYLMRSNYSRKEHQAVLHGCYWLPKAMIALRERGYASSTVQEQADCFNGSIDQLLAGCSCSMFPPRRPLRLQMNPVCGPRGWWSS